MSMYQSKIWFAFLKQFKNINFKSVSKRCTTLFRKDTRCFHNYLFRPWNPVRNSSLIQKRHFKHSSVRDDHIPRLIYLRNPFVYLKVKLDFLRLKWTWDVSFEEDAFRFGSTKAAVLLTDLIHNKNIEEISKFTTPAGYKQIVNDLFFMDIDPRLDLLKFRYPDIVRAVPTDVFFLKRKGRKHCFIDIVFVGMRNVMDFDKDEIAKVKRAIQAYEFQQDDVKSQNVNSKNGRVIFTEIFIRFYRQYSEKALDDWSIALYKIPLFEILDF